MPKLTTIWAPFFTPSEWRPLDGVKVRICGITFLLSRTKFPPAAEWFVSDITTGMRVAEGETRKAAIGAARETLERNTIKGYRAAVKHGPRRAEECCGPRPNTLPKEAANA